MCGRFGLIATPQTIAKHLIISGDRFPEWSPRYNIAPTTLSWVVRHDSKGHRRVHALRWGLVPSWSKDLRIGNRLINARAETLSQKPSFRDAFDRRRCLVLTDGFYEWQRVGSRKQAHHIAMKDEGVFAMAGLWERWRDTQAETMVDSFTIVTTSANTLLAPLHHRMPVIVSVSNYDLWLNPKTHANDLFPLMVPVSEEMQYWPVGDRVNRTSNDDALCRKAIV